jgi:arylsulfatase A-like enzyme
VRWPGHVPAGRVDTQSIVCGVDFLPTLCALGGAALPEGARLDGIDVSATWRTGAPVRRGTLFWEYGRNEQFFKFGPDQSPSLAVRRDNWKLLVNPDGARPELFDLAADPKEAHNLAATKPEVTRELTNLVMDWRATWPKPPASEIRP